LVDAVVARPGKSKGPWRQLGRLEQESDLFIGAAKCSKYLDPT
jgi:hypothetical protein